MPRKFAQAIFREDKQQVREATYQSTQELRQDEAKKEVAWNRKNKCYLKRQRREAEGSQAVLEKYKAIIDNEFNPPRGLPKARLSVAKKAISDFKKLSNSPIDLADLMLF